MHTLEVVAPVYSGHALELKSAPYLRLDRNGMHGNAGSSPAAVFNDHVWVFGPHYATEVDIRSPCFIRFEEPGTSSRQYGPFPELHIVGPSIFFGPQFEEVLVRYDREKHQWRDCREGNYYDTVLIETV